MSATKWNRHAAQCWLCSEAIPPGEGVLTRTPTGWQVHHRPARWVGSPVSGRFVGGCPK